MQKDGDIMNNVSFILAFSAGLLSFLSPCVLPLVPAYVSYITGTTIGETKNKNLIYMFFTNHLDLLLVSL